MLDDDFKYLTEKVGSKNLELLKQKKKCLSLWVHGHFKKISWIKITWALYYSSVKDGTADDNVKKLDGDISDEDYLTNEFEDSRRIWAIITIIISKKMFCY